MRFSNKSYINAVYIFTLFITLFFVFFNFAENSNGQNQTIIVLLFINMIILLIGIIIDDRLITLNKIYCYFSLIFMVITPMAQYVSNYYCWNYFIDDKYILRALLILIYCNIAYIIFYIIMSRVIKVNIKHYNLRLNNNHLFIISMFCLFVMIINVGFPNLFIRGKSSFSINSSFDIVFNLLLKYAPLYCISIFRINKKSLLTTKIKYILIILSIIILNWPISNSRFNVASIFLFIIAIKLLDKKKKSRLFDIILLFGIIFVFPFFSYFKNYSLMDLFKMNLNYNLINSFLNVDFDAFQIFARALKYVDQYGVRYGSQILNTIFFFVPRSILPIKNVNTGALIVNSQVPGGYNNVSCPVFAEIFVDFGYIGVIVLPILLAFLFCYFDKKMYKSNSTLSFFKLIYIMLATYMIYILRGSLAPTFLRLMGSLLPVFIIYFIHKISLKRRGGMQNEYFNSEKFSQLR